MKALLLSIFAAGVLLLAGCGQDNNSTEAPPKGSPPNTVQAPPGAKTPEQRGMENQADKGPQDGQK